MAELRALGPGRMGFPVGASFFSFDPLPRATWLSYVAEPRTPAVSSRMGFSAGAPFFSRKNFKFRVLNDLFRLSETAAPFIYILWQDGFFGRRTIFCKATFLSYVPQPRG